MCVLYQFVLSIVNIYDVLTMYCMICSCSLLYSVYVCMNVCMHVCMYACMYVGM